MRKYIYILFFVFLWAMWYFAYPYFLIWLEGFSCFSTVPDFTTIYFDLPEDIFRYMGAFLLQFYAHPVIGAAIQAMLPVLFVLCVSSVIRRLFKESEGMLWIAFAALPVYVHYQMSDLTLTRSLTILFAAVAVSLIVWLSALAGKPFRKVPEIIRNRYVSLVLLIVSAVTTFFVITDSGSMGREYEDIAHLEYLAENGEWNEILEIVSAQDAVRNEYKRKYVLLALVQTGKLPDYAFSYGLSSSEDFMFYTVQEPFCLAFNVLFYRSLGMNNPAVYHLYQQAIQSFPGMSFDVLRNLADIYLEQKDYDLARKYMDILAHSSCHGKWLKERLPVLESIRDEEPVSHITGAPFILESFLPDISSMVDRYPNDNRFSDYLLCGVLAEKDGNTFYNIFNIVANSLYSSGKQIPVLYQEALLLIASKEPDILNMYRIDEEVWKKFSDFTNLMSSGKTSQAKRKYAGTYWAYVY
ncbi:MAG: hypothetical protein IKY66_07120 [Bacteroidales bacterium]|nr:hypothetical protein [Bacteroidales bacterium]